MRLHPALTALALLAAATLPTHATAQTMKPGLWEITNQMQGAAGGQMEGAMAQMQKQMAAMSPEQRKMVEDMMAKKGVQMGATSGGGMSVKVCMTQEMVDRNDVPQQQGDCTHTMSPRSGNTQKFSYVCTKPPSSGEGQVTYTSPEAYSMKMAATTTINGKPEKMDMQANGKWLGGDCGSVKPLALPKK